MKTYFFEKEILIYENFNLKLLEFFKFTETVNIEIKKTNLFINFKEHLKIDKFDKILNLIVGENVFLNLEENICKNFLLNICDIQYINYNNKYKIFNFLNMFNLNKVNDFINKYLKIIDKIIISNDHLVSRFKKDLIKTKKVFLFIK